MATVALKGFLKQWTFLNLHEDICRMLMDNKTVALNEIKALNEILVNVLYN